MAFDNLERLLDQFLALGVPGNDCCIMQHGKVVFRRFSGYSDRENRIPMNGRERYFLCSCSKPVTCTAALQLWEQGRFGLDDELCDYFPEYRAMTVTSPNGPVPAKTRITIRHLFTMTAGLSYNHESPSLRRAWDETRGSCSPREVARYLAQEPLLFEPGTKWNYSFCHDVLAALVAHISGMPFQEYVKKSIFAPLGMKGATFLLPASEIETVSPLYTEEGAPGCLRRLSSLREFPYRLGADHASGGSGLVCSLEEYMTFLEALCRGERLLKRSTVQMMSSDQLSDEVVSGTYFKSDNYSYGLGVRCPLRGTKEHTDFGWTGAAGAYLAIDPVHELNVFYTQHVIRSTAASLRGDILKTVWKDIGK